MSFLYRTEAKGIQSWILATDRLQELAGASQIVNDLTSFAEQRAKACNGKVISAAAGSANLEFPSIDALKAFAAWWPMAVGTRAPGLTVVQAWVEGKDWEELQARLSAARNQAWPDLPEAGPFMARAGRTGLPAVNQAANQNGTQDAAMRTKQRSFKAGRDKLTEQLLGREGPSFLVDHDAFPEGYLAVVHADANGIGNLFASGGVKDPTTFSRALEEATLAAAKSAVAKLPGLSSEGETIVAARPVVLGGDDFTIIVPGRDCLGFAQTFLTAFQDETQKRRDRLEYDLHACAGVAIVKPGWPFHAAHRLAEELCQAAKRKFRDAGASGLAFHRVTTALSASWDEVLTKELSTRGGSALTMNPYSLEELEKLAGLAETAAKLPRGTLRQWGTLARADTRADTGRAREHWQRFREIAKQEQASALHEFDEALKELRAADPETGWDMNERTTPLVDVLEWHYAKRRSRGVRSHEQREATR
ncbi:MAG TPA: hypothetical protein VGB13_01040 [Candidatus Krumholzibacteria bacterium]